MGVVRNALLILVLLPGIDVAKEHVRDATICEINSHEREYAGRMVRVRGRVVLGMETFFIVADDCGLNLGYPNEPADLGAMAMYQPYAEPRMPVKFKLLRDDNYRKFVAYAKEVMPHKSGCLCIACYRYNVTVTMTGLLQVAKPGKPGFGHLNGAQSRLVMRSVSEVGAIDLSSKYQDSGCGIPELILPAYPYPGWNLPVSVPPFTNPESEPQ